MEEDDTEVGFVVRGSDDEAAVHVRMAARLVDEQAANVVEPLKGVPPLVEDRLARGRLHSSRDDPERLPARVVVDRADWTSGVRHRVSVTERRQEDASRSSGKTLGQPQERPRARTVLDGLRPKSCMWCLTPASAAAELGRTLVEEGLHALAEVVALRRRLLQIGLELELPVERGRGCGAVEEAAVC